MDKFYHTQFRRAEMIGPQTIFECNFKGDTSTFEDKIHEVLEGKEADKLLELFTNFPSNDEDSQKINKEIDELLAKMYHNLYGKEMNKNDFINFIYQIEDSDNYKSFDRYYFNKSSKNYNMDYQYFVKEEVLDFDSIMASDSFAFIDRKKIKITEEKFLERLSKKDLTVGMRTIKDPNSKKNRNEYYKEEINYYKTLEDYKKEKGDDWDFAKAVYQGKEIFYFKPYDGEPEQFIYMEYIKEPSISEKFPNQFNSRTKNIDFSEQIDKMLISEEKPTGLITPKGK